MTSWPKLKNAPIVEGLIDIHVGNEDPVAVEALTTKADLFATDYPSRTVRKQFTARFDIDAGTRNTAATHAEPDGVVLRSTDEKWVVQLHRRGLTISRLHPYGSWEELRNLAEEWWDRFCEVAGPRKMTRIATRFINRIPLPGGEPFDRTFATTFALGSQIPQVVAGYLLRVVVPFEAERANAVLTQSLEPGASECLLDIDVFAADESGFSSDAAWQKAETLRMLKNQLFFGSLTEDALRRFR